MEQQMVGLAVKSQVAPNNISATQMKNLKVPAPSLVEEKKFVAKIDALKVRISDATSCKQAILQKCICGVG